MNNSFLFCSQVISGKKISLIRVVCSNCKIHIPKFPQTFYIPDIRIVFFVVYPIKLLILLRSENILIQNFTKLSPFKIYWLTPFCNLIILPDSEVIAIHSAYTPLHPLTPPTHDIPHFPPSPTQPQPLQIKETPITFKYKEN